MKIINILKSFGFSEYEAKAILALLSRGALSAKEVSEISGIPRTSVYDVMNSLVAKGFVEAFDRPKKFRALKTTEILSILSKRAAEGIDFLKKELPRFEEAEVEEIKIYRGELVLDKLKEMVSNAKDNIIGIFSYISDEIREILETSKCKLVLISLNAKEVKNAEAYEFKRKEELIDTFRDKCHGFLIFDDRRSIFLFMAHSALGLVSDSPTIAGFSKMMLLSLLEFLNED
ncbi:TrmB family transcriptional regulator [Archaeoglobales archaeon]|nr:MAG: TrmB family transcriptional regulator [Archaeoglobales archaeon]